MAAQNAYIYGNTARKSKVEVVPDPRRDLLNQAAEQEKRARARSRAQEGRMGFVYVLFLTAAAIALVAVCYQFMKVQSAMNKNVAEISSMKVELEDMRSENDFHLNRINESVDMDYIRDQAVNRLGMKEATTSEVVTYTYDDSDYVRQYAQVPDGNDASVLDYFTD